MRQILVLLLCFPLVVNGSENQAKSIINEMEKLYRGNSSEVSLTMQVETPQYSRSLKYLDKRLGRKEQSLGSYPQKKIKESPPLEGTKKCGISFQK